MQLRPMVYLLYCEDRELGDRLDRALAGMAIQRVSSREALLAPSMNTCAVVFAVPACSDADLEWLRSSFGLLSPPCVVVAHLSVDCLRRLYPLRSARLQVVWADEAETRLGEVLEDLRRMSRGPMWQLGLWLLSDYSFKPAVKETIGRACGLHNDAAGFIPEHSVTRLARRVGLAPSTLSRYWNRDVPLRCSLKEFLIWAVLIWAVRARSRDGWDGVADQVGLRRRTLERNFIRMAGCRLAEAAEEPERVIRRFRAWADSVRDSSVAQGSNERQPAAGRAPAGQAT